MCPVPSDLIQQSITIIGTQGITEDAIESQVLALAPDAMTARRLIDWIPEAFGFVLVANMNKKITLPTTFLARRADDKWVTLNLDFEPIFGVALTKAQHVYHNGPGELFQNVALRSSMVKTVNNAINAGATLDGAIMSPTALLGIPAEVYPARPKPWWRKWFA
jgi:hypothetical protein